MRLSASHELLKFVQLKRRYRRETGVWPKRNQKRKEIDFDLACNSFAERGLLGGASHFPMLHANGTPMPSSAALPLAAVVTTYAVQDRYCAGACVVNGYPLRALPFEVCWKATIRMLDQRPDVGFGEWFRALKADELKGAGFLFQTTRNINPSAVTHHRNIVASVGQCGFRRWSATS